MEQPREVFSNDGACADLQEEPRNQPCQQIGQDDFKKQHHLTVCICTYKRPALLGHLLKALCSQKIDGMTRYSIVVVDNDRAESAKGVVLGLRKRSPIDIGYYCEPERNISLARNKTIEKATGDLIVFIDDDQFPEDDWIFNLCNGYQQFKADGILGPIRAHYQTPPPKWILKGKFFERKSFPTGFAMKMKDARHMRTGNVLVRRSMLGNNESAFDPAFGIIGGEDQDFFRRKIAEGCHFVWCNEAVINETYAADRFKRAFFLSRALRRGSTEAQLGSLSISSLCKSLAAIVLYTSALPVLLVVGHHHFMKFLIKDCDHIGKLLATLGVIPVKEWTIQ